MRACACTCEHVHKPGAHLVPAGSVRVTHFLPQMSSLAGGRRHLKMHQRCLSTCDGRGSSTGPSLAICYAKPPA